MKYRSKQMLYSYIFFNIIGLNEYLGCFYDDIVNRDLELFIATNDKITPEQCVSGCQQLNYLYAGIQYGSECRCADTFGRHGQASDDDCDYFCTTSERCGGKDRNSIYKVISIENVPDKG